jgi:hypothetical protein
MKIVTGPHAHYVEAEGNRGITAVPARVQFDLYTCSTLPTDAVLEACEKYFDLVDYQYVVLNREDGFVIEKTGQRI